ncbi:hypothetical protein EYS14_24270 [Alteromonadaceae bacterium M269]|nr:hypothetical protein EYS14_24270 [Alteromonadaceae bacterium M269]
MSGKFRFLLIAIATIITYQHIQNPLVADGIFITAGLIAFAYSYKMVNIYSVIIIITVMRILEIGLRYSFGTINAYTTYLTHTLIDIAVIILVVFKMPVIHYCRVTFKNNPYIDDLDITRADFLLGAIYVLYLILSVIMMTEHFIRHLDSVPFILTSVYALVSTLTPDDALMSRHIFDAPALATYLANNAQFFYNRYEWIKVPLNLLEHIAILATSYHFMRKKTAFIT